MTRDDVIAIVCECGYAPDEVEISFCERFAALVAAREREACAHIAECRLLADGSKAQKTVYYRLSVSIAAAIRARSNEGVKHDR